jgi:dTDP-4-dehydrorhamnose reductase
MKAIQTGSPDTSRSVAEASISLLAPDDGNEITQRFEAADGLLHMSTTGETSWHGFACAIVDGLRSPGVQLAVSSVSAIKTREFPTKAVRPHNSRLDMGRWKRFWLSICPIGELRSTWSSMT